VRPDKFFERKGDDIHTTVPVTFAEAYLGAGRPVQAAVAWEEAKDHRRAQALWSRLAAVSTMVVLPSA